MDSYITYNEPILAEPENSYVITKLVHITFKFFHFNVVVVMLNLIQIKYTLD